MGAMEGASAVELQGHSFDVDTQNPRRADATTDVWGGGSGGNGNVVLALDFVDSLARRC
jgi:hypothetical protein